MLPSIEDQLEQNLALPSFMRDRINDDCMEVSSNDNASSDNDKNDDMSMKGSGMRPASLCSSFRKTCDNCSHKKLKCSGGDPQTKVSCETCVSKGLECVFSFRRRPGPKIKFNGSRIGLNFQRNDSISGGAPHITRLPPAAELLQKYTLPTTHSSHIIPQTAYYTSQPYQVLTRHSAPMDPIQPKIERFYERGCEKREYSPYVAQIGSRVKRPRVEVNGAQIEGASALISLYKGSHIHENFTLDWNC